MPLTRVGNYLRGRRKSALDAANDRTDERTLDYELVQRQINMRDFHEEPACDLCGSTGNKQVLDKKGFRIVECTSCSLWFTHRLVLKRRHEHGCRPSLSRPEIRSR